MGDGVFAEGTKALETSSLRGVLVLSSNVLALKGSMIPTTALIIDSALSWPRQLLES